VGILSRLRRARVDDVVARSILGAAMTLAALALEWGLKRRSRRR
jgi:hypothetical protein